MKTIILALSFPTIFLLSCEKKGDLLRITKSSPTKSDGKKKAIFFINYFDPFGLKEEGC